MWVPDIIRAIFSNSQKKDIENVSEQLSEKTSNNVKNKAVEQLSKLNLEQLKKYCEDAGIDFQKVLLILAFRAIKIAKIAEEDK